MSASSTEYPTRSFSERPVPLASPATSVFSSNWESVSGCSPVSSIVPGGEGTAGGAVWFATGNSAMAFGVIYMLLAYGPDLLLHVVDHREEHGDEPDGCRPNRDDPDRGEDAEHQREDHLHAGFRCRFFCALAPLGAKRLGVDTQR